MANEVQNESGPKKSPLKLAIFGVAAVGVLAAVYVIGSAALKPPAAGGLVALRKGAMAKLEIPGEVKPVNEKMPCDPAADPDKCMSLPAAPAPDIALKATDGKEVKLAAYKGQVVVLNLWATWCAPCKIEMPTLDGLGKAYATQPVKVLAASVDRPEAHEAAKTEISKYPGLTLLFDEGYKMTYGLTPPAMGMPTTVIFDKKGVERARISGEADWNSPEAHAVIDTLLKEPA